MAERAIKELIASRATSDGAGVRMNRAIGNELLSELDPFLLLDNFGTDDPNDYIAGFPDHPHRGFETVTYMIQGLMRHRDSKGNEGLLQPGGVQWMTAGRGIIHSEMPEQTKGEMSGFQLWVNLPAEKKMCEPRYQEFSPDEVPHVEVSKDVHVRVIAGRVGNIVGPVNEIDIEPVYLDIELTSGASFSANLPKNHTAFVYVFQGDVEVGSKLVPLNHLGILTKGEEVILRGLGGGRLILVAGKPFGEPIARYGPFVMNTADEIRQAIRDFQQGSLA